jgi:hypothetical protein
MERNTKDIMNIYSRRISLFQDLLNCIIHERDNLINQDIKGIWSSLAEKQSILDSLEETKQHLDGVTEKDMVSRDIPQEDRDKILELSKILIGLKQEIKTRVKENVSFINETLDFFHELISTMTMTDADKCNSYGPYGRARRGARSLIYQGEV